MFHGKTDRIMNDKELIKFIFAYENKIRYAVFEKRFDGCVPKTGGNGSGHSKVSDPTAQKAIANTSPLGSIVVEYGASVNGKREYQKIKSPEKWLRIIDETYDFFDTKKQGVVMWAKFKENEPRVETCRRMGIKKSWYSILLNDVLKHAERLAVGAGLLNKRGY